MRGFFGLVGLVALAGCGGSSADVEGSAGGVDFAKTSHVFFGGPFIVISMTDIDCESLDFVRRNYEIGVTPTDNDVAMLQFSWMDVDSVEEGTIPVSISAAVSASVLDVSGGTFTESISTGGVVTVDSVNEEDEVTGSFEGLVFDDGTLNGDFSAAWCRNLKAQ